MTQSTTSALADRGTAESLARFTRNYYNYYTALVAQGFAEEPALRIVTGGGFPSLPSM